MKPNCSSCTLYTKEDRIIWGVGETNCPRIMFIGDQPKAVDYYKKEAYVDDAGILVKKTVESVSKTVGEIKAFYTNLVMCRPPNDRLPVANEIACCNGRLLHEIHTYKPTLIVLMGGLVSSNLLNEPIVGKAREKLFTFAGIPTIVTYAPNYILQNTNEFQTFANDIYNGVQKVENKKEFPWKKVDYTLVENETDCKAVFNHLRGKRFCLDIETYLDMKPLRGLVLNLGMYDGETTFIIYDDVFSECKHLFPSKESKIIVHNQRYEYPWMKTKYGITLHNVDDTLIMAHQLDERRGGKSLKNLGRIYHDMHEWDLPMKPYIKGNMHLAPKDQVDEYLMWDVKVNYHLYFDLLKELKERPTNFTAYKEILKPGGKFVNEQTYQGIKINLPELELLREEWKEKVFVLLKELQDSSGVKDLNPNSPQQLSKLLYDHWKLPNRNKGSTDEHAIKSVIDQLGDNTPTFLNVLLKYREENKIYTTYLNGLYDATDVDGRIHANFNLEGARTGRLSSSDPNLHNLPKHGVNKDLVRRLFIPDKGFLLAEIDYAQLELRVGAHMYNDEKLIELINGDIDMHILMASKIFKLPIEEVTKMQRFIAKTEVFGVMYLMDDYAAVYNLRPHYPEITLRHAASMRNFFQSEFVDLYMGAMKTMAFVKKHHYVETLFGRRRHFSLITNENRQEVNRQAVNMPIQGTASDICLLGAISAKKQIPREVYRSHVLIHDANLCSVKDLGIAQEVQSIMEKVPFETNVKFKTELSIGERWE